MTDKIDLFHVLAQFDNHNVDFFTNMTDEDNKQLHPFVIQRWLTGTTAELQLQLINEYSNKTVFNNSYNHRRLAWYVLLASCIQQPQRYKWLKTVPKNKVSNKPLSIKVVRETYQYSSKQAEEALSVLDTDDIVEMAEMLGWQNTEIQAIIKEHKQSKAK